MYLSGILHPNIELLDPKLIAIYKKFNEKKTKDEIFTKNLRELKKYLDGVLKIYAKAILLQKQKEAEYLRQVIIEEEELLELFFKKANEKINRLNKIIAEQIAIDRQIMAEINAMYQGASAATKEQLKTIEATHKHLNGLIIKNQRNINKISAEISKVENAFTLIEKEKHIEPLIAVRSRLAANRDYFRYQQWTVKGMDSIKKQQLELLEELARLEDELSQCTDPTKVEAYNQKIINIKNKISSLNTEAKREPKKANLRKKERELLKKKQQISHKKFGAVLMALENEDPKIKEAALKLKEQEDKKGVILTKEDKEFDNKLEKINKLKLHNDNLRDKINLELDELEGKIEPKNLLAIRNAAKNKHRDFSNNVIKNLEFKMSSMSVAEFDNQRAMIQKEINSKYATYFQEIKQIKAEHNIETKPPVVTPIEPKQPNISKESIEAKIKEAKNKANTNFKNLNQDIEKSVAKQTKEEFFDEKNRLQMEHNNIIKKLNILENSDNLLSPEQKNVILEQEINQDINDMAPNLEANLKKEETYNKEEEKSSLGRRIDNDNEIKEAMISVTAAKYKTMNEKTLDRQRYIEADPRNRPSPVKMATHEYHETKSGNLALDNKVIKTREKTVEKFDNLVVKGQEFCNERKRILKSISELQANYSNMRTRKVERICNKINARIDNLEKIAKENFPKWEVERQAVIRETENLYKLRQKVKSILDNDHDPNKPNPDKPRPKA